MKKILSLIIVVTVLLSSVFISKVFADQWSPTEDWGPQVGSYSPDWGRTVMYEYNDSAYNLYVSPQARFRFTQDAINSIRNYYLNFSPTLCYTFDISVSDQYNTTVSALNTTMYYSTLPSPHFDRDDDPEPWGNGYYDETEVTSLSPLSMLANIWIYVTDELLCPWWIRYLLLWHPQNKTLSMVLKEDGMKKIMIVLIILVSLTLGTFGFLKASSQDKSFFNMFSIAMETTQGKDSILNYKNKVEKVLDEIKLEIPLEEKYFVTITLSKYVTEEELEKLVKEYNIEILAIEGRSVEKGTNLKGTFFVTPENGMLYDKKLLLDILQRNEAEFKGFTAIVANTQNKDIQKLRNDKMVFLIDPSADTHFVRNPKHEKTNSWDGYAPSLYEQSDNYYTFNYRNNYSSFLQSCR